MERFVVGGYKVRVEEPASGSRKFISVKATRDLRVCAEGHHERGRKGTKEPGSAASPAHVGATHLWSMVGTVASEFGLFRKVVLGCLDTWYGHLGIIHQ